MRKVIATLVLTLTSLSLTSAGYAQSIAEQLEGLEMPEHTFTDVGLIGQKDTRNRTIIVNGSRYMVGESERTIVTLYGTSAGAYELLDPGMAVEVEYFDFGDKGRVAIRITGLNPNDVEKL